MIAVASLFVTCKLYVLVFFIHVSPYFMLFTKLARAHPYNRSNTTQEIMKFKILAWVNMYVGWEFGDGKQISVIKL